MAFGLPRRVRLAWLAVGLAICSMAAAEPDSPFAAGTAAFESGDYRAALRFFEAARAAGSAGPSVPYNIAVSRYRLGDYEVAEAEFADLGRRFPEMRALAEYNRGLALLRLERDSAAREAFESARTGADPKISGLAAA